MSDIFHCNIVLYDGRNIISNGLPMRDNIGTLGMDFAHFSLCKPREKYAKSIPQVPMLSLRGNPLEIIYVTMETAQLGETMDTVKWGSGVLL